MKNAAPMPGRRFSFLKLIVASGAVIKTGKPDEIKSAWLLGQVEFSEI
jgi:hypothetical protein